MADLFVKYNCTNCQDDITGIRVHCAECSSFDLCLQCFAAGAEIGDHRNDHPYQFMDTGSAILSIFRGKGSWSAREELELLDAIEQYGFGNWEDISKHIETRSAEDAKEEYVSKFLSGTIGKHTWIPAQAQRPNLKDHTAEEDNGPLGTAAQKLPPLEVNAEEAKQLGYMPNRDCFGKEYDPNAEEIISSLTLNPDDVETDLLLKLAQVDIYTRRLRERARRKRMVRDYQLAAIFFRGNNNIKNSKLSRDQREFRDRFRVFAQFYTAHEYDRLIASIERERDLRIRLAELCRYRWNGLTKIDECVHFEQHAALAPQKNTGPYGHGRTDNLNTGNRHRSYLHSPQTRKANEIANGNEGSSNSTGQRHMYHTGDQTYSDASLLNKSYSDSYRGSSGQQSNPTIAPMMTAQLQTSYQINQQQSGNIAVGNLKHLQQEVGTNLLQQGYHQQQSHGGSAPQSHQPQQLAENLLSKTEMQLCASLNLPPTRYITLKTVLLSGAPLGANSSPIENLIRKYLIKAGWLSH